MELTSVHAATSPRHPVIVMGGIMSTSSMYEHLRDIIRDHGYEAETVDTGGFGMQSVQDDAQRLMQHVKDASERSRAAGGDGRVDIVAHSKGGLTARVLLERMGAAPMLGQIITIETPHQGASRIENRTGGVLGSIFGPHVLTDLAAGSRFVTDLNRDLPAAMKHALAVNPDFRLVSIGGENPLFTPFNQPPFSADGNDGMVQSRDSKLPRMPGIGQMVFSAPDIDHGSAVGIIHTAKSTVAAALALLDRRSVSVAATVGAKAGARLVSASL